MKSKAYRTILRVAGIIAIVMGLFVFTLDAGNYDDYEVYGGDAYTGIQQASAQAANNTMNVAVIAKFGFGSILSIGGLVLIAESLPLEKGTSSKTSPSNPTTEFDDLPDL